MEQSLESTKTQIIAKIKSGIPNSIVYNTKKKLLSYSTDDFSKSFIQESLSYKVFQDIPVKIPGISSYFLQEF